MTDAGLGSIVRLQLTSTPAQVRECLKLWAGNQLDEQGKQMLMPVVRTLWRDILGFIPIYSVFLFIGIWVAFSLPHIFVAKVVVSTLSLGLDWRYWAIGLAVVGACAAADLIEDSCHLRYIHKFPSEPSTLVVLFSRAATCVKNVLFFLALIITGLGMLALA